RDWSSDVCSSDLTAIRGDLTEAGATTAIAVSESAMTYRHFLNWLCAATASLLLVTPALANPTMLFDLESGRVITHQEAFKRWYPASLSKLMTAYVSSAPSMRGRWRSIRPSG